MDSFGQAAAHAAKLGSLISAWMLLIMFDKHLLGLPLFEGSLWRSPRIPPRFTIKGGRGGKDTSRSKSDRHSAGSGGALVHEETALSSPSPVERGFTDFATIYSQPSQPPHFLSNSLPLWSGTTALSLYQPLEVHDPFVSPSSWLMPGCVGIALLVLVFAFLGIVTKNRWCSFGNSQDTQAGKVSDIETLSPNPLLLEDSLGMPETMPPPYASSVSPITSVQTPPSVATPSPPPPPPQLSTSSLSAIASLDSAEPFPVLTSQVLGRSMIASVHSTPSAPAPTPSTTLNHTSTERVQGSCEDSGEIKESTDSVQVDVAASKKRGDGDICGNKSEKKDEIENGKTKVDATVSEDKREDRNDGSRKNGSEAGEGDGKEDWEEMKGESNEDGLGDSGDGFENDGLDRSLVVGEGGKKKKHKIRQNVKRRAAKKAAAEEASKEAGEAPDTFCEDTKECERKEEKSNDIELAASDSRETIPGGASEAKKKTRRRRPRKHKPNEHALNDIDRDSDDLAEDSHHGIMTNKTEKNEKGQEEKGSLANDVDTQAKQLALDYGQSEDLVATGDDDQIQKKRKRRRKPRSSLSKVMSNSWQREVAQAQQLPIVDGQSEDSFVLGGEDHGPVVRLPVEPAMGRTQTNRRTSLSSPTREKCVHAMNVNLSRHNEIRGFGDHQRLKNILDDSAVRRAETNNGAIPKASFGNQKSPFKNPHHGQSKGRAPLKTPKRNEFSDRVPWVAPTFSYTRRSYAYPDLRTINHAQRPMYFGPGVEPRDPVDPSTSTPWASNHPISGRDAGLFALEGPVNEPATWTRDDSAAAGFFPRGSLMNPSLPFEHRIDGFAKNADLAPSKAPYFVGSHSSSHSATTISDGPAVPFQGLNAHVDDTVAGEIRGFGISPAPNLANRSDDRYQYFRERGVRSRSSPPRSRSQSRFPVRNRRPRSLSRQCLL